MPLVRVDVPEAVTEETRHLIGDVVYDALRSELSAPRTTASSSSPATAAPACRSPLTTWGIERSEKALIIQVTLNAGRSVDLKRAFYAAVADGLHERVGVRREDVFINLVEVPPENWSFGNGIAQYAPTNA